MTVQDSSESEKAKRVAHPSDAQEVGRPRVSAINHTEIAKSEAGQPAKLSTLDLIHMVRRKSPRKIQKL
jgi:hypothetical protein